MPGEFQEQTSETLNLQRYLGTARRRYLHFLIPMFVGWLVVWGSSWVLPERYKSGTLILVEQPIMPKDYVTPNVNDDLQERLQSITEQILSRTRLQHIIETVKLYSGEPSQVNTDDLVERMRGDIKIELIRNNDQRISAFNVYYSAGNPKVAQQVTSELTSLFINENLEVRQQQSEGTTKFLEGQLENARQALAEQEQKIREYKSQHIGELPTQLASNLQILGGLQSQLQSEQDGLNTAKQQHVYLETLIGQYRSLQGPVKGVEGAPLSLAAIDQELDKLKAKLADLSSRYTERHPDVRNLKDQIAKNEKMREQLVAATKKADNSQTDDAAAVTVGTPVDPTHASPIGQLQSQLHANQIEINNREQTVATLQNRINEYQTRLNQEPVREQQLTDLTRGYQQSKEIYDELLKKKNESAMATRMELLQQGERFRVLDPPSLPVKPDFPNRLKFCGLGLAAGLALGVVVVGALEMIDDRVYDEKEIKDLLPVPVISEIPVIVNTLDERRNHRRMWLGRATAAAVLVSMLAGSAFSFFHG
jgi:polysaccharide chain length determinant protein (PEP-CTERM system associated)